MLKRTLVFLSLLIILSTPSLGVTEEDEKTAREKKQEARATALQDRSWLAKEWMWDINYEVGFGVLGRGTHNLPFSRFRTGITRLTEPQAYTVGAAAEMTHGGNFGPPAFGLQSEFMSLRGGVWLQLATMMDTAGDFRATTSIGWQVFGVDLQYRPAADQALGGFVKLRVPVNWIARAISKNTGN